MGFEQLLTSRVGDQAYTENYEYERLVAYSTFASADRLAPTEPLDSLRGTSTRRLNSATSTPSWLSTRVCTLTVPRSGFDCDSRFSSTSDSQNRVSPWNTGAGCLSSSVAR